MVRLPRLLQLYRPNSAVRGAGEQTWTLLMYGSGARSVSSGLVGSENTRARLARCTSHFRSRSWGAEAVLSWNGRALLLALVSSGEALVSRPLALHTFCQLRDYTTATLNKYREKRREPSRDQDACAEGDPITEVEHEVRARPLRARRVQLILIDS